MLRRYKKISLQRTLWSSAILTIILSTLLGCWLLVDSFNIYQAAKERKLQFTAIYKVVNAFNSIGRERGFTNELVLANPENKQGAWDELKTFQKQVDANLDAIDKKVFTPEQWNTLRDSLTSARNRVDIYKNKLATDPNETKLAIHGMIDVTETFREIMRESSLQLLKKDNVAVGSLLQLLILSSIRDNTGRLAAPFLIALHFNSLLSIEDVENTARRLERLKGAWEVLEAIPDDIPTKSNIEFERQLELTKQEFMQESLPLIIELNDQENDFSFYPMTAYEFSQQYRSNLENVVAVQEYYLNELFKFHYLSENRSAIKVIIVLTTMLLITILMVSLALYIQKSLLKPLLILNKVAEDLTKGNSSPDFDKLMEKGELQSLFNSFDILDYQRKEQQVLTHKLAKESNEDPLTGLANRRMFQKFAYQLLANVHTNFPATMIIIDLDHFKKINDTWGHPFGDEVLVKVANILKSTVPNNGLAARLGGEEFVILLPNKSNSLQVTELLHDIQSQINASYFTAENERRVSITASFGVSESKTNDLTTLFSNTDQALYKAKEAGRNCIRYHIDV